MRTPLKFLLLFLAFAATAAVYWTGLSGDYLFDDNANILNNERFKFDHLTGEVIWQILVSGDAGLLKRPISMISFALNVATTGFDPFYFKLVNLLIHLVNGALVFLVCMGLLDGLDEGDKQEKDRHFRISLAVTAIWLLHPLNLTSVLYIVQRMTSLAALFSLAAILLYIQGRRYLSSKRRIGLALWATSLGVMFPLALLCKETGILVPVFVFVIELTVFRFKGLDAGTTRFLKLFHGAIVVLPIMALAAMLLINPEPIIGGYKLRDYSLGDRLLTQARVIFLYLHMSLSPTNGLLGLYHDDFVMSRSLMNPWTTSLAMMGLAALLALGWFSIKRMPLVAFAIFWFLGGHLLESTFIPLEMIHEHRNYLPLMGLVLGLCGLLFQPRWPGVAKLAPVLSITVAIAFGLVTAQRSEGWSSLIKQAEFEVRNHPNSERANIQMARVYATLFYSNHDERYFAEADKYFSAAIEHSTISPAGFIGRIRIFYMAGKEPPTELFQALARRLGSGPLVPAAPTLIQNIANCALLEDCKIPHDQMLMILSAYLNNPDVPDQMKQIVALVNAQYHADVLKDGPGALYILQKVVLEQPTYLNGRRNLARLYRFSGDYEKALHEVKVARSLDKWRQLAPELDDEEKKIRAAMADPTKGTLQ